MGLFDFFKKKETKETPKPEKENSSLALSMPMFKGESYSLDKVLEDLKSHWGLEVSEISGDDEVATLTINGMMAAIAKFRAKIWSQYLVIPTFGIMWKRKFQSTTAMLLSLF